MYAIFETGGKQYKVDAGDVIRIEKIKGEAGDKVKFGNVLAFSDGESLKAGTPYLDAATVNATIISAGRGEKVIIFKFKAKKDYRRKQGHRQPYMEIEIDNFTIDGKKCGEKPKKQEAKAEAEEKAAEAPQQEEKPVKAAKVKKTEEAKPKKQEVKAEAEEKAEEVLQQEEKPVKAEKAKKTEEAKPKKQEVKAEAEEKAEEALPQEEKPAKAVKAKAAKAEETEISIDPKLTKADLMAKLDELGVEYKKSAKKEELAALLGGENK